MKKIITYGSFDILHWGHINLLKRAKELGEYLIIGLSSDEFNSIKHKSSYLKFDERKLILGSIKYVNEIIIEKKWGQKIDDIIKYNIDIFVMGDDWIGEFDFLKEYCEVVYLSRTEGISTTAIKKIMG